MKIRLLIDARLPGGVETHVMNLCEGLVASGHECMVIFVCDYADSPLYGMCRSRGIAYLACQSYRELVNFFYTDKPDIIHTHGYKANISGRLIGLVFKSQVISTFHSGEPPVGRLILYNWLDRWSSFFSRNIAVNAAIAAKLPSKALVIPNFVDVPDSVNPVRLSSSCNVYFIGRFNPEKGPLNFCQLSSLPSSGINWHMVGAGPLLAVCQEKYGNSIHFHGAITNMESVWPNVDMLCITSIFEGLPLVLLEAMSRGIPVVSFDVGNVKEVLPYKEYIIKPSDISGMSSRIHEHFLKSIESRMLMAENMRAAVISRFSSDVIIPKILVFYNECLT